MTVVRPGDRNRLGAPPLLALSGAYLALTVGALLLLQPRGPGVAPALWFPPAGLAYGYLLRSGPRGVPVVAVALGAGSLVPGTGLDGHGGGLAGPLVADIALALWFGLTAGVQRRRWNATPTYTSLAWFAGLGITLASAGAAGISTAAAGWGGLPADPGVWARWVLGDATAMVTMTPVFYLISEEALTRVRLAPRVSSRRRLAVVGQASVIVLFPALFVLVQSPGSDAVTLLPLALAALCWMAFSRDLTRASLVLAVAALLLGATAETRFGDSLTTFQLQSVMFAGAVAALFAAAGLVAEAGNARRAAVQSTRWRALVEVAPAVVARVDRAGRWSAEPESLGPDTQALVQRAAQVPALVEAAAAGTAATVHWRSPEDESRRFVTHLTPLPDAGCLAVTTETTGLHGAEVALAWERSHDRETDLPNRDLLLVTAEHAVMDGGPASLVLIDVERAGWRAELLDLDPARLMLALADRVRGLLDPQQLAQGHALIARVGDDQFGVLVPTGVDQCRELAEAMVAALRRPVRTPGTPLAVTAWAGVAQLDPDRTPRETLRLAAAALHSAIEGRRQQVVVLDDLSMTTSAERARLAGEVIGAVDRGELEVVFQPDVALPSGRLTGVEALVRWRRPEGFAAATELFVQLAEEAGAVQAVDAWVMEESLRRLGGWRREHPAAELELALNVSALSLTEDLPDRLFETCLRYDVPPWHVRLEVTETALADDSSAPEVLRRVRSRGCRVALDDFGTGYATLSRLHRLPVDVVKLDRSFLSPITEDVASQALVSLVLGLAGPLRVEVVVEGVETPQQRDLLIDLGCRRAQGFLFSRPCPAPAIDELLAAGLPLGGGSAGGSPAGGSQAGGPGPGGTAAGVDRPVPPRRVRAAALR
jgi:EAL domain-containing protein (putative c-di-GMP-specific phosphodiesterase class I)/GGDEF domain-containing protein